MDVVGNGMEVSALSLPSLYSLVSFSKTCIIKRDFKDIPQSGVHINFLISKFRNSVKKKNHTFFFTVHSAISSEFT